MYSTQAAAPAISAECSEYEIRSDVEHQLRKDVQIAMTDVSLASNPELLDARVRLRLAQEKLSRTILERLAREG